MKFKVIQNTPVSVEETLAFASWRDARGKPQSGIRPTKSETFTSAQRELGRTIRDVRVRLGVTIREAATAWDCRPAEVSNLEMARTSPATIDDFATCLRLLLDTAPPARSLIATVRASLEPE